MVVVAGSAVAAEMRACAVVARVLVAAAALWSVVAEVQLSLTTHQMESGMTKDIASWPEDVYTSDVRFWVAARLQPAAASVFQITASRFEVGRPFRRQGVVFNASWQVTDDDIRLGRMVVIGPFRRGVESDDFGLVKTQFKATAAAAVKAISVSEVFCFDCPVGSRAIACDPFKGRSTECEPCTKDLNGLYCTGEQGRYSFGSFDLTYFAPSEQVMTEQGYRKNENSGVMIYSFDGASDVRECETGTTCHAGQRIECPGNCQPPLPGMEQIVCPGNACCGLNFVAPIDPGELIDPFDILDPENLPRLGNEPAFFCPRGSSKASPDELLCPAGSYCKRDHAPRPCPAGGFCPAGSRGPRRCPAGSSSAEGQAACLPCEPGTFQDETGQGSCKKCADSVSAGGATACSACDPRGSNGFDKFNKNKCICKPGQTGLTCSEQSASRPVSNGGAATGGGASPGGASATGTGGSSAVKIVAGCAIGLALVAIAVLEAKRRREASATKQPAPGTELSAQQQQYGLGNAGGPRGFVEKPPPGLMRPPPMPPRQTAATDIPDF